MRCSVKSDYVEILQRYYGNYIIFKHKIVEIKSNNLFMFYHKRTSVTYIAWSIFTGRNCIKSYLGQIHRQFIWQNTINDTTFSCNWPAAVSAASVQRNEARVCAQRYTRIVSGNTNSPYASGRVTAWRCNTATNICAGRIELQRFCLRSPLLANRLGN